MVLLTMTDAMVEALRIVSDYTDTNHISKIPGNGQENEAEDSSTGNTVQFEEKPVKVIRGSNITLNDVADSGKKFASEHHPEPSTLQPTIGNPISHDQIVDLWKRLNSKQSGSYKLEELLKGSKIYLSPTPPKPEPTFEYKALMARLRRQEEERTYERMTNPPQPMETFVQMYSASSAARAFASSHQNIDASDPDDDGLTYADVDRQMGLILNVLLSIVACAGAIWVAARWWSTPARLALSMSGSILVGVAEVVVYSGYIRRLGEARGTEKGVKEIKEVVNTWVVGPGEEANMASMEASIAIDQEPDNHKARKRK